MKKQAQKNILHKSLLLYRRVRYRHGHGVHSPFVFNLITKVIEERCAYYRVQEIELLRKKLRYQAVGTEPLEAAVFRKIIDREAISRKKGALLFRLANHLRSRHILQLGAGSGLSTLYLTAHRQDVHCVVLEDNPQCMPVIRHVLDQGGSIPVDLRTGVYKDLLHKAAADMGQVDFVFFNTFSEQNDRARLFTESIRYVHDGTVFVFDEIKASRRMRDFWKEVCRHPEVTVTLDLYSFGIVFFNKKLHKQNYIVYF